MRVIKQNDVRNFAYHLYENEMSKSTIEKYTRDIQKFCQFVGDREIDKSLCIEYKESLSNEYAVSSANSMIASINAYFKYVEWYDCIIKQFKVQKRVFCSEESELTEKEYKRLENAASKRGNERLYLIMKTIFCTGIRVSELKYITVEAIKRGEAEVNCKGKKRVVFIVKQLKNALKSYAKENNIKDGAIFVTKGGKSIDRSNIWRSMKKLCSDANVSDKKVFPHNLRHLFARMFHKIDKDIAKLADVLGHSSINTTRIYIMSTGAEHKEIIERMIGSRWLTT